MTIYTDRVVYAVPIDMQKEANLLARSIDYDVGGDMSFGIVKAGSKDVATHYVLDILLSAPAVTKWVGKSAAAVSALVATDVAQRWQGKEQITGAEVGSLLAAFQIKSEPRDTRSLEEVLAEFGLARVVPDSDRKTLSDWTNSDQLQSLR